MTKIVNIHEAKTHLSRLLEEVRQGEHVIIAKAGVPVAQLTAIPRIDIVFGGMVGLIEYDDPDIFLENDTEILEMFDEDLGLRDPS